jgi:hypothetical protein
MIRELKLIRSLTLAGERSSFNDSRPPLGGGNRSSLSINNNQTRMGANDGNKWDRL